MREDPAEGLGHEIFNPVVQGVGNRRERIRRAETRRVANKTPPRQHCEGRVVRADHDARSSSSDVVETSCECASSVSELLCTPSFILPTKEYGSP